MGLQCQRKEGRSNLIKLNVNIGSTVVQWVVLLPHGSGIPGPGLVLCLSFTLFSLCCVCFSGLSNFLPLYKNKLRGRLTTLPFGEDVNVCVWSGVPSSGEFSCIVSSVPGVVFGSTVILTKLKLLLNDTEYCNKAKELVHIKQLYYGTAQQ